MTFKESDFTGCKYNPLSEDFEKSAGHFIEAIKYKDKVQLAKYIVLMYDPYSILRRHYTSIDQRQMMASQLAGMDMVKDRTYITENVFGLKSMEVIEAIDYFLKNEVKERLAYMIVANEQTFYEYGRRLMAPIDEEKAKGEKDFLSAIAIKTKLSEDMAAINERLEKDIAKFYEDDAKLIKVAAAKKFRPEDHATRIN